MRKLQAKVSKKDKCLSDKKNADVVTKINEVTCGTIARKISKLEAQVREKEQIIKNKIL